MTVYEEILTENIPNSRETQTHKFKNFKNNSSRIRTEKPKSQHNIVKMKTIRKNENIKKTANKK